MTTPTSSNADKGLPKLYKTAFTYPAIDNHAHNLLKPSKALSNAFPLEGLAGEAEGLAQKDLVNTISLKRAAKQLVPLYDIPPDVLDQIREEGGRGMWDAVKEWRGKAEYESIVRRCFDFGNVGIQCLLLDDLLMGIEENCWSFEEHDPYMKSKTKRILRVEVVAQELIVALSKESEISFEIFEKRFRQAIENAHTDPQIVAFKSIICYRTGLSVSLSQPPSELATSFASSIKQAKEEGKVRIEEKVFNDWIVCVTCQIAGKYALPVQFHTGLGDSDISLPLSTPSHLQPLIRTYSSTPIVLLHSSYPFTKEAGYLTGIYKNCYLDFGEIFPMVSRGGQEGVVREMLEMCPGNKILWSTDGHWWPETFYLGSIQARQALFAVLSESVHGGDITESEACEFVENALFHNSNELYKLGLEPLLSP
ncbi:hypothetical protein SISNIDRAFT_553331 [Sistotremastrum niveocremeum HHB9708]|uniref:Amidohydrolase-related domain-containing protein n=2 Tax=Sistotremastraceae TaxID=3402574 RepID=A0A164MXA2_9AGAM|nr:hypothetical protein SISNIDRAFT_553331 [Sistotremastrum niveocremeum HHB9708]KZT32201.1 hypothetical protein SISSUDRAFT_1028690 [Sistotremastrum suecicum HHB10207 ss-3]